MQGRKDASGCYEKKGNIMEDETKTTAESVVTPDNSIKKQMLEKATEVIGKENVIVTKDKTPLETPLEATPKKWVIDDVEFTSEDEIKPILKLFKKEKSEDFDAIAKEFTENRDWKNKNADTGRKLNQTKTELAAKAKEIEAEKEQLANSRKRVKEDILKENEINKTYDAKVQEVKTEIKAKKEEIYAQYEDDHEKAADLFEEFKEEKRREIYRLDNQRDREIHDHKSKMEQFEREQSESQKKIYENNLMNLTQSFAEDFPGNELLQQMNVYNRLPEEERLKQETLNNYPLVMKIAQLGHFATNEGIINLKSAYELQQLREAAINYSSEKAEWEKKIVSAEKAGYDKAVQEFKKHGVSLNGFDEEGKPIIKTDEVALETKQHRSKMRELASSVFQKTN